MDEDEIWGTSRSLPARFEVGQDSSDLHARFEVGQNSRDLQAGFVMRDAASTNLYAKLVATHSQDLLGTVDIQRSATLDLSSGVDIRVIGSADLQCTAYIGHVIALYCRFEAGQNSAELLGRGEIQQSDSAELLGKFASQATQDLLGKGEIQQSYSAEFLAKIEIGQDARDLFAKAEVGQGSVDLLGRCDVRQSSLASLLAKLSIPASVDLLARFRPAQEVLNLSGRLVVRHPAFPVQLEAIFSLRLTNAYLDLRSMLEMRHSSYSRALGSVAIRHEGAPVELFGMCWVPHLAVAELLGKATVGGIGSAELPCGFSVQSLGDLYAKFAITQSDSVMLIADDELVSFLDEITKIGRGFISAPTVENDESEKMVGSDSFKISSAYAVGRYKEIRFGHGSPPLDLSHSEGIAFYWWGSGGLDQQIDFVMRSSTGSWVGKFYDGPAEWRWVFLSWDDFTEIDIDGSRPNSSNVTGFFWIYHTPGVRRVDYIVGWRRQDLRGDFEVRHEASRNLAAEFEGQVGLDLRVNLIVKNLGSVDLPGNASIQYSDLINLPGRADIVHWADLHGRFEVGQDSADLFGDAKIRHVGIPVELLGETEIRGVGSAELLGKVHIRSFVSASVELLGRSEIQRSASFDLLAKFEVKQGVVDLFGDAKIRHVGIPIELLGKTGVRHIASVELLGRSEIQQSLDLPARFGVGQGTRDLLCGFVLVDYVDFRTWIESDGLNRLSQTKARSTWASMNRTDDKIFLYEDFGVDYWGDFTHLLDLQITAIAVSAAQLWRGYAYSLTNLLDDWQGARTTTCLTGLAIKSNNVANEYTIALEYVDRNLFSDSHESAAMDVGTTYYLKLIKSGTSEELEIYSDAERTSLIETLNITMVSDYKFRYLMGPQSGDWSTSYVFSGYVENLDLGL